MRVLRGTYHPLADNNVDVLDWEFDVLNFALDYTIISFFLTMLMLENWGDIRDLILEPVLDDVLPSFHGQSTSFNGVNMFGPSFSSQHYASVLLPTRRSWERWTYWIRYQFHILHPSR